MSEDAKQEAGDRDRDRDEKKNGEERADVCRDFLKNICNRGSRCKFYHPENIERSRGRESSPGASEYNFCIDFQNRGCNRENCRFVHAHRDDVDRYKQTKEVTVNLARAIAAVHNGDTINGIPFCKEFQTGSCSRGAQRCRYWHINIEEERERRRRQSRGLPPLPSGGAAGVLHSRGAASGVAPGALPPPYGFGSPFSVGGAAGAVSSRRPLPYGAGAAADAYDSAVVAAAAAAAVGGKRARYDVDDDYVRDLERKNAELNKETEGLKRELQRERERYEDLYALFRQRSTSGPAPPPAAVPPVGAGDPQPYGSVPYGAPSAAAAAAAAANAAAANYYQNAVPNNWTAAASRTQWTQ